MVQSTQFTGGHNRRIEQEGPYTSYILHNTPIVRVSRCGRQAILDTGGWRTDTTQRAINQVATEMGLPFRIFRAHGEWFVYDTRTSVEHLFHDGMHLNIGHLSR